jgi:hypothetical protein
MIHDFVGIDYRRKMSVDHVYLRHDQRRGFQRLLDCLLRVVVVHCLLADLHHCIAIDLSEYEIYVASPNDGFTPNSTVVCIQHVDTRTALRKK